ncbi:MAG: rhodanese-like domain-containing protein [Patescibacteria group bacterium]
MKLADIEAGRLDKIPKDTPVALYCRSGRRSSIAYDILTKAGYTNITNA